MSKTHLQVIEAAETRLLKAVTSCDKSEFKALIHPDFVYTNENGEVFLGMEKLQINEPKILHFKTTEVQERDVTFFNNIAVVNSLEKRTGTFRDLYFERQYRITRIWKFDVKSWKVINATVILMP